MSLKRALPLVALVLFTGALGACHKSSTAKGTTPTSAASTASLPDASSLITKAQTAMSSVQSVHFTLTVDGTISGLPLQSADGVLTHDGDAKGTAKISELGQTIQADFVLVDNSFYLKALTGGYQKLPLASATSIYDPSAILDPNRGIPKLLSTAQNPKTVGSTTINGKTAYEVSLTPDPTVVKSLVPGAPDGTTGSVWIDQATSQIDKAVFTLPSSGGGKATTVTMTLDQYDAPVTISAP